MKALHRTTIRDVAEHAGVSISTVSKALRSVGYVRQNTRDKINKSVSELSYHIDKNARNLRTQQSHVIGVILHNHINTDGQRSPFLSDMILAIAHQVVERGYDVLFLEQATHDNWYSNPNWHTDVTSRRVDGFILLGGRPKHKSYLQRIEELSARQVAFVEWSGGDPSGSTHCGIGIDGRQAAYDAVKHLINLGRKRVAFVGPAERQPDAEMNQRRLGYIDAMRELDISSDELTRLQVLFEYTPSQPTSSFSSAQRMTQQLIDRRIGFDAIFASTDLMAMAAINTLRHNGRDVPKDIAIVGFDDISAAEYFNPPLTTVSQDIFKGGALLVDKFIDLLSGKSTESTLLPSRLVIRESCGSKLGQMEQK